MYLVDLYLTVRLACHVEELSQREAARRFGIIARYSEEDASALGAAGIPAQRAAEAA